MRRFTIVAAALAAASAAPAPAQEQARGEVRAEQFAQLPYWPGYWVSEYQAGTTIGGIAPETLAAREEGRGLRGNFMALLGSNAPWSEAGRARFEASRIASAGRKANGWGFPLMMNSAAPLQFLITPEEVLIINPYNDVRHIYTDGREMPAADDMWPTVWGTSVGRWEGDVLVVETVMVRNPNDYFHGAPPLSDEARYEERIWIEGDRLIDQMTIIDPVALAEPWKARLSFVRDEGFDRMIHIDYDNDRTGFDGEHATIEAEAVED